MINVTILNTESLKFENTGARSDSLPEKVCLRKRKNEFRKPHDHVPVGIRSAENLKTVGSRYIIVSYTELVEAIETVKRIVFQSPKLRRRRSWPG